VSFVWRRIMSFKRGFTILVIIGAIGITAVFYIGFGN
jgi:hypothetical protein